MLLVGELRPALLRRRRFLNFQFCCQGFSFSISLSPSLSLPLCLPPPLSHSLSLVARAPIFLIGYISNSNFQVFIFKTNFCVCRFLLQKAFLKLINIFVFFAFILVDAFSGSIKTEKSQKNLFTLAQNNFGERKLSYTYLNFGEILFAGTKRAVPGGQYRSILLE